MITVPIYWCSSPQYLNYWTIARVNLDLPATLFLTHHTPHSNALCPADKHVLMY